MRYMGFDLSKVAYDGGALRPAMPIAIQSPALTETVREAMQVAPPELASHDVPKPAGGGVAVSGSTPSGAPIVMQRTADPEEAPAVFVPPEAGGDVVPINDRAPNGPPMSRDAAERASFNVGASVDDSTLLAAGVAFLILLGVGAYVVSRR